MSENTVQLLVKCIGPKGHTETLSVKYMIGSHRFSKHWSGKGFATRTNKDGFRSVGARDLFRVIDTREKLGLNINDENPTIHATGTVIVQDGEYVAIFDSEIPKFFFMNFAQNKARNKSPNVPSDLPGIIAAKTEKRKMNQMKDSLDVVAYKAPVKKTVEATSQGSLMDILSDIMNPKADFSIERDTTIDFEIPRDEVVVGIVTAQRRYGPRTEYKGDTYFMNYAGDDNYGVIMLNNSTSITGRNTKGIFVPDINQPFK